MTTLSIRSHADSSIVATLVRDVRHPHPEWVHAQLGTSDESELQICMDAMLLAEYAEHPGQEDAAGVFMPLSEAAKYLAESL